MSNSTSYDCVPMNVVHKIVLSNVFDNIFSKVFLRKMNLLAPQEILQSLDALASQAPTPVHPYKWEDGR